MGRGTKQFLIGTKWSNRYGDLIIKEYYNKRKILVQFVNTGYERYTDASSIRNGAVKDPYHPTVSVVGSIGSTTSSIGGKVKRSYHTWRGMLARCYEYADTAKTYYGKVEVCKDWWCFENYEKWYNDNFIDGYEIDKDFTELGCKLYSPETCCFIPAKINAIMGKKTYNTVRKHEGLSVGVSYHVRDEKYTAQCFDGEKLQHFGYHSTPESAFKAYKTFKENLIKRVAQEYYDRGEINETVYTNLMNYEVQP